MQVLRIAVEGTLEPEHATPGLKALLARTGGVADFAELEARLAAHQAQARAAFERELSVS